MKLFLRSFLNILDLIIFRKVVNIIKLKNIEEIIDLSKISFIKRIIDIKEPLNKEGVVVIIVKIVLSTFISLDINRLSILSTIKVVLDNIIVLGRVLDIMKEMSNFSQLFNIIRKALGTLYINISLTYILEVVVVEFNLATNRLLKFI